MLRASVSMEDAEALAAVMDVRSAHPLSLAFWYCSHLDSSNLQWERRDWYVSWADLTGRSGLWPCGSALHAVRP